MEEAIHFNLNGRSVTVDNGDRTLLWVLRVDFGLTSVKYGCGEGLCGACTVLVDGVAERSCRLVVNNVKEKNVTTIEGLASEDLHPMQKAFIEHDALQCGFCTPGMILQAVSLLSENPHPSRAEIISGMDDHLCRCGSYGRIIDAIAAAANQMSGGGK